MCVVEVSPVRSSHNWRRRLACFSRLPSPSVHPSALACAQVFSLRESEDDWNNMFFSRPAIAGMKKRYFLWNLDLMIFFLFFFVFPPSLCLCVDSRLTPCGLVFLVFPLSPSLSPSRSIAQNR